MNQPQSKIIKLQSANELRRTMDCYFARLKEAVDTRNKKIA